jgi:hypothetical protein
MSTDHSADPTIEVSAEGTFFTGCFCMKVNEDNPLIRTEFIENCVGFPERTIKPVHKDAAFKIHHGYGKACSSLINTDASPWSPFRIVGRPQERRLLIQANQPVTLVPNMVPGRQDIDSKVKELTDDVRCQTKACSSIFTVGDHQVDHMLINQAGQKITDKLSPGATDDVTYKKDFQNNSRG